MAPSGARPTRVALSPPGSRSSPPALPEPPRAPYRSSSTTNSGRGIHNFVRFVRPKPTTKPTPKRAPSTSRLLRRWLSPASGRRRKTKPIDQMVIGDRSLASTLRPARWSLERSPPYVPTSMRAIDDLTFVTAQAESAWSVRPSSIGFSTRTLTHGAPAQTLTPHARMCDPPKGRPQSSLPQPAVWRCPNVEPHCRRHTHLLRHPDSRGRRYPAGRVRGALCTQPGALCPLTTKQFGDVLRFLKVDLSKTFGKTRKDTKIFKLKDATQDGQYITRDVDGHGGRIAKVAQNPRTCRTAGGMVPTAWTRTAT